MKILDAIKGAWQKNTTLLPTLITMLILGTAPLYLPNTYFVHIASMIGISIPVALGMYVVTGASGQINMGQYGFYCIGSYSAALLTTRLGLGFWSALAFSLFICMCLGIFIGLLALRIEGPYLALTTLGFSESVRLILNNADWAGRANGIMRIGKLSIFGYEITDPIEKYLFIAAIAILSLLLVNNIMRSRQGRRFRAIKDDTIAASVIGVNVRRTKMMAFCISAMLGGLGGCMYASYVGYVNPLIYTQALQVKFLLMIVIGGLSSQWGALVGAVLVTVFYELTRAYGEYQNLVAGLIMLLVILFMRHGIVGTVLNAKRQRQIKITHELEKSKNGMSGG